MESSLGTCNRATVALANSLSQLIAEQERWREVGDLQSHILQAREVTLGPEHPRTIYTRGELGNSYFMQGLLTEAKKLQRKLYDYHCWHNGYYSNLTWNTITRLAKTCKSQGNLNKAKGLLRRAFASQE